MLEAHFWQDCLHLPRMHIKEKFGLGSATWWPIPTSVVGWFRPLLEGCTSGEGDTKLSLSWHDHVVIMIDFVLFATSLITISGRDYA